MLMKLLFVLLSSLGPAPDERPDGTGAIVANVTRAGAPVGSVVSLRADRLHFVPGPFSGGKDGTLPEQVLTTTIQDPEHPGEPWVVTSYRRPDESEPAFIKRHFEMVDAVRAALRR
jgi:hypothetical protein